MHEASITGELVRLAAARAPSGARVRKVLVRIGCLTGISPEAMTFYFEVLREPALGPQAELEVRLEPLRGRCSSCAYAVESRGALWSCPACGRPTLTFDNGGELDFMGLVVDDDELDHDRTEDSQEERGHRPREPAAP
jgi:hydrogenase nickel incorporation protein HypA/HybF